MERATRYPPELRERAMRLVREHRDEHPSEWAAIQSVAGKLGMTAETLRKWVRRDEIDHRQRPGATSGYYAALRRPPSARRRRDETLEVDIRRVWDEHRQVYGADKVWAQLRRE